MVFIMATIMGASGHLQSILKSRLCTTLHCDWNNKWFGLTTQRDVCLSDFVFYKLQRYVTVVSLIESSERTPAEMVVLVSNAGYVSALLCCDLQSLLLRSRDPYLKLNITISRYTSYSSYLQRNEQRIVFYYKGH